ncbi:PIR Superfamily Protein [Plasmodium ovale wallikeri]|uniref:PIR Superfamily Protein n=1 Tax=Plasmodium ovale wallikeri TaxID=864142 RepID=A0A1A9AIR5_PLAOA|nr:PIR Superfamily Protein [Plasmodium ovale wallikeri]
MSTDMQTFYNIASSYAKYKNDLDSYKRDEMLTYMGECSSFVNEHITNNEEDPPTICNAVMKFLNLLKEESESYKIEGSKYLFYWLHNDILKNKSPVEITLILYKELYRRYNDEDNLNILNKYIEQMNENTSDKLVKLTGIYDTFKKFEKEVTSEGAEKKCTSDCVKLFSTYVHECRTGYDNDFCNELKIFREKYNFFIKTYIYCDEQYFLPPVDLFDIVRIIIVPLVLIVVTSFIFPLLYKFTPFGQWIQHKIVKKKNMWDNTNQEENHLLHNYEMDRDDSSKKHYKLVYSSSLNS